MARKTFFSFHYKQDIWRAASIRNSWLTRDREAAGFFDSAEWEKVKQKDDSFIKKWIDEQLKGTSVTVVLIGEKTAGRKWINYEITSSYKKRNGMLGIYIHKKKDKDGNTAKKGRNPLDDWYIEKNGKRIYFSTIYNTYDWIDDDGYNSMGKWIEIAASDVGK